MKRLLNIIAVFTLVMAMTGVFSAARAAQESLSDDALSRGERKAVVAYAARLVGDKNRARLIVDFDAEVSYKTALIKDPKQVVITLSKTVFNLNDDAGDVPDSVVESLRFGTTDAKTARIVLPLASTALIDSHKLKSLDDRGRHRLIVDLVSVDAERFDKVAVEKTEPLTVAKVEEPEPEIESVEKKPKEETASAPKEKLKREFLIVLDPGHGGIDFGAVGKKGTAEKDVTLGFAKELASVLEEEPGYKVSLTRADDSFVSLTKRLEFARDRKADLLISIHADSLRQRHIRGATVYTLSKKGSDSLARRLASKQNRSDLIAGLALPELEAPVNDILIDLTRRETKNFSIRFAQGVVRSMRKGVRLIRNPLRSADFFVLKAPEVPSVLLELGYLSNRRDEKLLASKKWHKMVASRLKLAVDDFFAPRMASKP